MRRSPAAACGIVFALTLTTSCLCEAADPALELARRIPGEANTLSVIRVAKILDTPRAKAEGWAELVEQRFLAGASQVPPWVDTFIVGSLVRPARNEEVWSTAVLRMPPSVTLERIARREATRVERLSGLRSVKARRGAWLVEIEPRLLGIRTPAARQEAARWARAAAEDQTGELSPVLAKAAESSAHIALSIDLTDASDSQGIRRYLTESDLLPKDPSTRVRLPQLLMSLRGVSLFVTVDTESVTQVVIDFDESTEKLGESVAAVFRQYADDLQLSLDELESATVRASGKSVTLKMTLSDESLRRVVSLVTAPSPPSRANDETIPSTPLPLETVVPEPNDELLASRRYLQAVSQLIDDLARVNREAKDYARTATWHDNFARRIDQLPAAGVDRELLAFGQRVSQRFRGLAASLRGQAVRVNAEQQTLVYDVDYRPGWASVSYWGAVGYRESSVKVTSNLQQVRERQAAAVTKGAQQRIQIWNFITNDRTEVEARMREKHGDDFFSKKRR